MEKKMDLRVQRTYKLLTDSLIALLMEKKFEEIQVAEICERAMIRRATFYKHFGDKYELFTYMVKDIQQTFDKNNAVKYDAGRPQTYYLGMIAQTLNFLEQNKAMVTSVINSSAAHILIDLLSDQIEFDVRIKLTADEKRGAVLPSSPEYLAPVFTGALIYTCKRWILHDWKPEKEVILKEALKIWRIG